MKKNLKLNLSSNFILEKKTTIVLGRVQPNREKAKNASFFLRLGPRQHLNGVLSDRKRSVLKNLSRVTSRWWSILDSEHGAFSKH